VLNVMEWCEKGRKCWKGDMCWKGGDECDECGCKRGGTQEEMARYLYSLACGPCTPLLHVAWGLGAPPMLVTSRRGRSSASEALGGAWLAWRVVSERKEPIETAAKG